MRDGTPILIRTIGPEDKHLMEVGFEHQSDRSRYFRFLHPVAQLSSKQLQDFTAAFDRNHAALAALDVSASEAAPIGAARYIRMPEETEAAEFHDIYKLDAMVIPTNEPVRRVDYDDVIYRTKREKYAALIEEIERMYEVGRPVLVGTVTVEVSELIARMLLRMLRRDTAGKEACDESN